MLISRLARAGLLALAVGAAAPTFAVPLMDMRAEDLLFLASDVKTSMHLNANQQTLWSQVESRARAILRERQHRREALQEQAKAMLARPDVELRELNKLVDTESATSGAEDRQLRELWLGLNDALDDKQRAQVATFLGEQLVRVVPEGRPGGSEHGGGARGPGGGGRAAAAAWVAAAWAAAWDRAAPRSTSAAEAQHSSHLNQKGRPCTIMQRRPCFIALSYMHHVS